MNDTIEISVFERGISSRYAELDLVLSNRTDLAPDAGRLLGRLADKTAGVIAIAGDKKKMPSALFGFEQVATQVSSRLRKMSANDGAIAAEMLAEARTIVNLCGTMPERGAVVDRTAERASSAYRTKGSFVRTIVEEFSRLLND